MVFSSFVFVSAFLPLLVVVYYLAPRTCRNFLLLAASVFFYAWGDAAFLWIIAVSVLCNYLGALALSSHCVSARGIPRWFVLTLFLLADFSLLFYYKYSYFVFRNVSAALGTDYIGKSLVLPLGISFYTFQGVSYLVDVYRGVSAVERSLPRFALYIAFFPQLVAGPIVKYHDISEQIKSREETFDRFWEGMRRFAVGFAKKVLIANTVGHAADLVFSSPANSFGPVVAWCGAVAYALQIYYDFGGYSDMAIGLGGMFGFRFLENFNLPYSSTTITDFWRRWHISLSSWFREYLYIPLGGNRSGRAMTVVNLGIVFLATGLWHGAAWTFVAWGALHGLFVIAERVLEWSRAGRRFLSWRAYRLVVVCVVLVGWVLFRSPDMSYAWLYVKNMVGVVTCTPTRTFGFYFSPFCLAIGACALLESTGVARRIASFGSMFEKVPVIVRAAADFGIVLLFAVSICFLAGSTYNPFIYFRF